MDPNVASRMSDSSFMYSTTKLADSVETVQSRKRRVT